MTACVPPVSWMPKRTTGRPRIDVLLLQVLLDRSEIGLLAAQPDEDYAADVGVRRVVRQRAQHHVDVRAVGAPAALVVGDRDDAVDVGELLAAEDGELGQRRNLLRLVARAHAGRDDEQEVACADASVLPAIAAPGRAFGNRRQLGRARVQIGGQVADDRHVVAHVADGDGVANANPTRGADGLTVLQHKGPVGDGPRRKPVPRRHRSGEHHHAAVVEREVLAWLDLRLDDGDVVAWIDDDGKLAKRSRCSLILGHEGLQTLTILSQTLVPERPRDRVRCEDRRALPAKSAFARRTHA